MLLSRIINNLGLKELGQVEDYAEDDDRDDVDDDSSGDTSVLFEVSVCVLNITIITQLKGVR